jgi:hypothetical protein
MWLTTASTITFTPASWQAVTIAPNSPRLPFREEIW